MGLLALNQDDPLFGANMALAAGLLQGNFGAGLQGFSQALNEGKQQAIKNQLLQAQIAETQAQAQERQSNARKLQMAQEQALREQQGIPGLYRQPGMTGGAPAPSMLGDVPMFSQPMGVTPMKQSPGGFDVQGAFKLGITDPKRIAELAALADIGRQEVARTVKGIGPDGREFEYQIDKFGNKVGEPFAQYRAPLSIEQGNSTTLADPYNFKPVAKFQKFQSPDNAASVGASYANAAAARDQAQATRDAAKIQSGFKNEADLRKEFEGLPEVKNYKQAFPAYASIKDATTRNTTQSDINIVYGLAKLYDPTSVVREGEYATVANSPNIPEKVKGYAQYLAGGGRLSPETKAQILAEAEGRIGSYKAEVEKSLQGYQGIAQRNGVNPSNVFTDMGDLNKSPATTAPKTVSSLPKTAPKGTRARDTTTNEIKVFNGFSWVKEK